MKLATYQDASRDGQLVVVSRDLSMAHYATGIAGRLQQVLDDWRFMAPQLRALSEQLNSGKARHAFAFEPARCMAPLPRAYQWVSGAAFPSHAERLRQAEAGPHAAPAARPDGAQPLLRQGASDRFLGACEPVALASEALNIDFEAQLAVISGDLAQGASPEEALEGVRLLMLASDVALRAPAAEPAADASCRPATAFSPVAVTPDELGDAWRQGRLNLVLQTNWNERRIGLCEAGSDMALHFGQLLSRLCALRPVSAGSILGSGPVSNRDWSRGYHCIAEKRAVEVAETGRASTGFMKFGDTLRIEVRGRNGQSVFGAIEQRIAPLG